MNVNRDEDDLLSSKELAAFVGVSSTRGLTPDEEPTLDQAFARAAQLASEAGYAGRMFHVGLEIVPEDHNQWIRTFRVIITPDQ